MDSFIELIKALGLAPVLFIFAKMYVDSRVRKKKEAAVEEKNDKKFEEILKRVEEVNDRQTVNIASLMTEVEILRQDVGNMHASVSNIENDTRVLNELHKHSRFSQNLTIKVEDESSKLMILRKLDNEEIRQILKSAVAKFKRSINEILMSDFAGIDPEALLESYRIKAKEIRSNVNKANLELEDPDFFLNSLKQDIILPHMSQFSMDVSRIIAEKSNGKRRSAFEEACLKLLSSVINDTITAYNKEKKND